MKDQKEIQIALEIWNLINKLSDLLWDRYDKEFLEIYLKEEDDKYPSHYQRLDSFRDSG